MPNLCQALSTVTESLFDLVLQGWKTLSEQEAHSRIGKTKPANEQRDVDHAAQNGSQVSAIPAA